MGKDWQRIVHLQVQEMGGHFFVTSPNLAGLNVHGVDVDSTYQAVVKMVKAIYRHNLHIEVEVHPATAEGQMPKLMKLCDELVVKLKAA